MPVFSMLQSSAGELPAFRLPVSSRLSGKYFSSNGKVSLATMQLPIRAEFAFRFHTPLAGKLATLSFPFLNTPPAGFAEEPLLRERGMIVIAPENKQHQLARVLRRNRPSPIA